MRHTFSCAVIVGLVATSLALDTPAQQGATAPKADAPAPGKKTIHALFECASGKTVTADFVDGNPASVKLSLSDGRSMSLRQTRSGSGARYANAGETIVFWNKGRTAFMEEKGKTTYADCTTS